MSKTAGESERHPNQDLELWKHYASFGGEDKNRMVTIVIWLLGGAAFILWHIWLHLIETSSVKTSSIKFCLTDPLKVLGVAIVGMGISALAGYVSLLYGGYSNRNWAKADQIARYRGWRDPLPNEGNDGVYRHSRTHSKGSGSHYDLIKRFLRGLDERFGLILAPFEALVCSPRLNRRAKRLARPCEPLKVLAPVFEWFFRFSVLLCVVHLLFVIWSVTTMTHRDVNNRLNMLPNTELERTTEKSSVLTKVLYCRSVSPLGETEAMSET